MTALTDATLDGSDREKGEKTKTRVLAPSETGALVTRCLQRGNVLRRARSVAPCAAASKACKARRSWPPAAASPASALTERPLREAASVEAARGSITVMKAASSSWCCRGSTARGPQDHFSRHDDFVVVHDEHAHNHMRIRGRTHKESARHTYTCKHGILVDQTHTHTLGWKHKRVVGEDMGGGLTSVRVLTGCGPLVLGHVSGKIRQN